jgi:geranylgeranyl reductase family protein
MSQTASSATHDIVVAGGGPAGPIAALVCARAGARVLLLEKRRIPRDKACGEALIPDAIQLLRRLNLYDRVRSRSWPARALRIYAPSGEHVDVRGECMTLRRRELDATLVGMAAEEGADVQDGAEATAFSATPGGALVGVHSSGRDREIRTAIVILATGAAAKILDRFNLKHRTESSVIALRTYFELPSGTPEDLLHIWFEKPVLPYYGWIFPMGNGIFNVGVGGNRANLRQLFALFTGKCSEARRMLSGARMLKEPQGAPLRTSLVGTAPSAERLLVAGEAVGTTYAMTGEGIGKAMESGALAAEIALEALARGRFDAAYLRRYDEALERRFRKAFRQYQSAERWLRHPRIASSLVRKAGRHQEVRGMLEDMLAERRYPTDVLSLGGLLKLLLLYR